MSEYTNCIHQCVCAGYEVTRADNCQYHAKITEYQPVRNGKWEWGDDLDIIDWICCSECGYKNYSYDITKYCPNCGAKMDGGAKE